MKLDELNRSDIITDLDKRTKMYSKYIKNIKYIGVTSDYVIHVQVPSSTGSGTYLVKIKLSDYPSLEDDKDLTVEEKVRLSLDGDIKVSCECPAWSYWGYKYISTQLDTNQDEPESRFPIIRNPNLEGTVCKHIYIAIRGFGKGWKRIASDISNGRFIEG